MNNIPSFLALESANETPVIGSFKLAEETNSFDAVFESARSTIMQEYGLDPMIDINQMIKNKGLMERACHRPVRRQWCPRRPAL